MMKILNQQKFIKHRQKIIRERFLFYAKIHIVIIFISLLIFVLINDLKSIENRDDSNYEIIVSSSNTCNAHENTEKLGLGRNLSKEEKYLLAKITMAEAEGEDFKTKVLVISTILNRVESNEFPNTIEDVIFQNDNGVYQFTPIEDGRWDKVEPNEDCWKAVEFISTTNDDFSDGALYFEACQNETWQSRNLELICQSDNTRFYK